MTNPHFPFQMIDKCVSKLRLHIAVINIFLHIHLHIRLQHSYMIKTCLALELKIADNYANFLLFSSEFIIVNFFMPDSTRRSISSQQKTSVVNVIWNTWSPTTPWNFHNRSYHQFNFAKLKRQYYDELFVNDVFLFSALVPSADKVTRQVVRKWWMLKESWRNREKLHSLLEISRRGK